MARLATITLQAMDNTDVFLIQDVFEDGMTDLGEIFAQEPADPGLTVNHSYVNGNIPKSIHVTVEGDTSVIYGWLKTDQYSFRFRLQIYIEYEEAEALGEEEKL